MTTPYDKAVETERELLSMAVINKNACSLLAEIEQAEFLDSNNRGIKKIIDNMFHSQKNISITTVYNEIVGDDLRKYFEVLMCEQYIGDVDTIFMQFQQFHRLVKLQPLIEELNRMAQMGHPDFEEKFEELADAYSSSRITQEAIVMKDLMKKKPEEVKQSYVRYGSFGIPSLEKKIKYLYGGQYICIAAAPGEGKSTMAGIIAEAIPDSLIMSYEMTAEEIHDILVSRATRIDSELIESGTLDFQDQRCIEAARRRLSDECSLRVCDSPLNMSDMFAFMKRQVSKHGIKCVVIDYAQIIPGLPGKGTQTEKYEMLSRKFKIFARETKTVVIALSQLNKQSLSEDRMPTLADLRGSLSFGSDADKVIFLFKGKSALGKNRKGRVGEVDDFVYDKKIHTMR